MTARRISEPKNILEKVIVQFDSLFSINFFDSVFSSAQRTVAPIMRKSPSLISGESFEDSIISKPRSIIASAKSCFLDIFSFKNMIARIVA